jgi:hypothetical protein
MRRINVTKERLYSKKNKRKKERKSIREHEKGNAEKSRKSPQLPCFIGMVC